MIRIRMRSGGHPHLVGLALVLVGALGGCQKVGGGELVSTAPEPDYSGTLIPAACQHGLFEDGVLRATLSGGTTIDGPYTFCLVGGVGPSGLEADSFATSVYSGDTDQTVTIGFEIPQKQFAGVGTYACGYEENIPPSEGQYCTIHIHHKVGPTGPTQLELSWFMSMGPQPGPHAECSITVATPAAEGVKGTVSCSGILDDGLAAWPTSPNAGKPISVDGSFEFLPVQP